MKKPVYLMVGIKLADYIPGDSMREPCATCSWSRPPKREGYNALCTKYETDLHVGIVECNGKNGQGYPRQLLIKEVLTLYEGLAYTR